MGRMIGAIIAGFIVCSILSMAMDHVFHITNIYPPYGQPMLNHGLLLLAFTYRIFFEVLGAYLTAVIAGVQKAMRAVLILGIIGSILWLLGAIAMREFAQPWYNILGVILGTPSALIGGKLYMARNSSVEA